MAWFKRQTNAIHTATEDKKKETPDGYWYKTPSGVIVDHYDLNHNNFVCTVDGHHLRVSPVQYFGMLFDEGVYTELETEVAPTDPLDFEDTKKYKDRLLEAQKKTGQKDALRLAVGKVGERSLVVAAMDFGFIGGSMGAVVGEKIARGIDYAIANRSAFMIISQSGGARMMEAGFSLMQMAKTSAKLAQLADAKLPYISYITDPTTGGVTASFAMLGDVNIAEPGALIAFAGPRVVKETIGKDLPEGFQTSEFLLEHGFLDFIIDRREIRERIALLLKFFAA